MRLINWGAPIIETGSTNSQRIDSEGAVTEQRTHVFRPEFDEPVPDEFIYGQRECPAFFSMMKFKNGVVSKTCFVIGRSIRQLPDVPQCYDVTIEYANKLPSNSQDKPTPFTWIDDPLARPALIDWETYASKKVFTHCKAFDGQVIIGHKKNGKPIYHLSKSFIANAANAGPGANWFFGSGDNNIPVVTSAGEPLILEEEVYYRKFTITKNVARVKEIFARGSYINEDEVNIGGIMFPQFTLWLLPILIGHIKYENGKFYYPLTMTILENPDTWIRQIRNAGYYMRSPNGVVNKETGEVQYPLIPIRYEDGSKVDRPVLLDKKGWPLNLVRTNERPHPDLALPGAHPNTPPHIWDFYLNAPDNDKPYTPDQLVESTLYFMTKTPLKFMSEIPLQ